MNIFSVLGDSESSDGLGHPHQPSAAQELGLRGRGALRGAGKGDTREVGTWGQRRA